MADDIVRDRIRARFEELEKSGSSKTMAGASREMKRNHAYIQQYLNRGSPRLLRETERKILARYLDLEETLLIEKNNSDPNPTSAGESDRVRAFKKPHWRRLFQDLLDQLQAVYAEEDVPISPGELGLLVVDELATIIETYPDGIPSAERDNLIAMIVRRHRRLAENMLRSVSPSSESTGADSP